MPDVYIATDWKEGSTWTPIVAVQVDYVAKTRGVHGIDPARFTQVDLEPQFGVILLERHQDVNYRFVLERLANTIMINEKLLTRRVELLVGIDDVGGSIKYLLEGLELSPRLYVVANAGAVASYDKASSVFSIPRPELMSTLSSAYATNMVRTAASLRLKTMLNNQLSDLRIRSDAGARLTRDSLETDNDDLARTLAVCIWRARQEHTRDLSYLDRLELEKRERGGPTTWDPLRYARKRGGAFNG